MYVPVKEKYEKKFESMGLGKGVFWVIGRIEKSGACSRCGRKLKYLFIVKSSDNKTFPVGSECVKEITNKAFYKPYRKFWDDLEEIRGRVKNCKYCGDEIIYISDFRGKFYPVDYKGIRYVPEPRPKGHWCPNGALSEKARFAFLEAV